MFVCAGCKLPSSKTICNSCRKSILSNSKIIPLPIYPIEGVAPLYYSFERTQALIRNWKETSSSEARNLLFRMPEGLRRSLIELHFTGVVPIPQDRRRSYLRTHESALEVAHFFAKQLDLPMLGLLELKNESLTQLTGMNRFDREFAENPFQINEIFNEHRALSRLMEEKLGRETEMRILLVDDLITSGSTLSKAGELLLDSFPQMKIWAGSLGFRPKLSLSANFLNAQTHSSSSNEPAFRAPQYRA